MIDDEPVEEEIIAKKTIKKRVLGCLIAINIVTTIILSLVIAVYYYLITSYIAGL